MISTRRNILHWNSRSIEILIEALQQVGSNGKMTAPSVRYTEQPVVLASASYEQDNQKLFVVSSLAQGSSRFDSMLREASFFAVTTIHFSVFIQQ
jgi:hypothetical protein